MFHLTMRSSNVKTGPIPVSVSTAQTCPDACPLKHNGCYAEGGPLGMHWRKVTEGQRGVPYGTFLEQVRAIPDGQLWRHNASGDLPGDNNEIGLLAMRALVQANMGKRGFTYTHKPVLGAQYARNRAAIRMANLHGFTVNLSANNLAEVDELLRLKIAPVVTLLPHDAPKKQVTAAGNTVITCPATYRDDTTCAKCKLCAIVDRKVVIGFPVHGSSKRKAEKVFYMKKA